jgi:NodT family efflux transporter outer membrane factor (OMF) lipoprotein
MRRAFPSLSSSLATALLAALTACAVGPDFARPAAPDVNAYDSTPTASQTADGQQYLHQGQDIPAQWWALFHSDALDQMVTEAIRNNPDLESADASLSVAQDNLAAGNAELFPTVTGDFSSVRQKTSSAGFGGFAPSLIYTLHNASVGVNYGLDLWGGTRRAIEGLQAQADEAKYQREAAYLSLTANVVTAAIQEASLREQITATRAIIGDQVRTLKLLNARFEAGAIARTAVALQQTQVADAQALLPPLEHQLTVQRHVLSVLLGQMPQQEPGATFNLDTLKLPQHVPLSVPSKLVEERPDIRVAEESLHAASAQIGVAIANRLPQVTLSADIGSQATKLDRLFTPGGGIWSFGGDLSQTIFDAGALSDQEDAARDTYKGAAAQYRKTVIAAFQDVADTLHALQSDADALNAKTAAEKAAAESLSLTHAQLNAGAISTFDLLTAEQAEEQARLALVEARAQRYADTAALFAALGGGWWNRDKNTGLIIGDDVLMPENLLSQGAQ